MKQFRRKPHVVSAIQVDDSTFDDDHPNDQHIADPSIVYDPKRRCVFIQTPHGTTRAEIGDWIVRDLNGDYYPCRSDIFDKTFETI